MRFDDYHRTIIGYHGTRLSVARAIVNRQRGFKRSENRHDWLGHGVYFWEYAPQQALWWAEHRKAKQKWNEPVAILGAMIRLGICLDLLDPYNVKFIKGMKDRYCNDRSQSCLPIPANRNHRKFLDCAIFQHTYGSLEKSEDKISVDSARAVYVPTGKEKRIWSRSWISEGAHIQICVRKQSCILGTWLHYPDNT